jgi:hypothetical protein
MRKTLKQIAWVGAIWLGLVAVWVLTGCEPQPRWVVDDKECMRQCVLEATRGGAPAGLVSVRANACANAACAGHWEHK